MRGLFVLLDKSGVKREYVYLGLNAADDELAALQTEREAPLVEFGFGLAEANLAGPLVGDPFTRMFLQELWQGGGESDLSHLDEGRNLEVESGFVLG